MRETDFFGRLLLVGLALGAGVGLGLLIAPARGDLTRERLSASARSAADAARDRTSDLAEPLAEAARTRARRLSERHLPLTDDLDVIDTRGLLDDLHPRRS